jgi:hypothetical protein
MHSLPPAARCLFVLALLSPNLAWGAPPDGVVGVDYVPLGRADLAWVEEGRLSGTLSGEGDGMLQAPLRAWGGVAWKRHAILAGFGMVRVTTTTWGSSPDDGSELVTRVRQGGIRPSLDYRFYPKIRETNRALPWVGAGLAGVIPTVAYESEAWVETEEEAWLQAEAEDRARIGAFSVRVSGGAELMLDNGLVLGVRQAFDLDRYREVDSDSVNVSVLMATESALTLGFVF